MSLLEGSGLESLTIILLEMRVAGIRARLTIFSTRLRCGSKFLPLSSKVKIWVGKYVYQFVLNYS